MFRYFVSAYIDMFLNNLNTQLIILSYNSVLKLCKLTDCY